MAEECASPGCWIEYPWDGGFTITLDSNASTGYRWVVTTIDENHITQINEVYLRGRLAPGAAGRQVFTFLIWEDGESVLEMAYVRSWEPDQPANVVRFRIHSESDANGSMDYSVTEIASD